MLRFTAFLLLALSPAALWAADAPRSTGLGGGGRAGIVDESLFANPASLNYLKQSLAFGYYTKSRVSDWNAGGRALAGGIYDASNPIAKAGFSWIRESRVRLVNGGQIYADRTEYRMGLGKALGESFLAGATGSYVVRRDNGNETKIFNGSAGLLYPAAAGMRVGVTYENFIERAGERPPQVAAGATYALLSSVIAYADYGFVLRGPHKDKRFWSGGVEIPMISDLILTAGISRDAVIGVRAKSVGVIWQGPRTAFEYALRITSHAPIERDHVFGITVGL